MAHENSSLEENVVNSKSKSKYNKLTCWMFNDNHSENPNAFELISTETEDNGSLMTLTSDDVYVLITGGLCTSFNDTCSIKRGHIGELYW